jgi:hypothetical protein
MSNILSKKFGNAIPLTGDVVLEGCVKRIEWATEKSVIIPGDSCILAKPAGLKWNTNNRDRPGRQRIAKRAQENTPEGGMWRPEVYGGTWKSAAVIHSDRITENGTTIHVAEFYISGSHRAWYRPPGCKSE